MVRVSGWSGPRTRRRSASRAANRSRAPGRVAGLPGPREVVAGGQGVGVVGAEDPLAVGEQGGEQVAAPAGSPASPLHEARLPRVVRVSGMVGAKFGEHQSEPKALLACSIARR